MTAVRERGYGRGPRLFTGDLTMVIPITKWQTRRKTGTQSHGAYMAGRAAEQENIMLFHRYTKRTLAIAAVTAIFLSSAGMAYAYWTTDGGGTSTATAGTSTAVTVNQVGILTALFPGDTAQTLSGDFNNTSSGPVHITTVTVSIASVHQAGVVAVGCSSADYTLTGAAMSAVQSVPVGSGVGSWTGATIQFKNTASNQDACKGAVINLAYAVV
jgi:hypothetical protein